jgi:hypothetical protein
MAHVKVVSGFAEVTLSKAEQVARAKAYANDEHDLSLSVHMNETERTVRTR